MKKLFVLALLGITVAGGAVFLLNRDGWLRQEPQPRIYKIGVVLTPPTLDSIWDGFRSEMENLGYKEGQNVAYIVIEIGKDYLETKQKVAVLVDQNPDLIFPLGSLPARAAKEVTEERQLATPVVVGIMADPIGQNLVKNLKSSGNNLTGINSGNELISSKRLELFREMIPALKRVIIVWNHPQTTGIELFRRSASQLGVAVAEKQVANVGEFDAFLDAFTFRPGDGMVRATDNINALRARQMAKLGLEKKIPVSGTNAFDTEQGAVMSYGPDFYKMGRQAARLVHRILGQGALPSEIPIELPETLELIVNLKTAEEIGIVVSPEFLSRANRIIR